jgi:membrane protease YdiL (CAAX protease family)
VTTGTVAGLLVVIAAVDITTTRLTPDAVDPLFRVAVVFGLFAWSRGWVGLSWNELGFCRDNVRSGLRWGLLAMLVVAVVIAIGVALPATRSYFENSEVEAASTVEHYIEPLVAIPFGTVLFEEFIFRGVLLAVLMRWTTTVRAVVVGSVAFGLWHIPPALSDAKGDGALATFGIVLGTIAFTTAAGAIFSFLRLKSGSLLAPILAHIASNSFAYVGAVIVLDG